MKEIKQTMSEFLLALAQKEIAKDVLGVEHVVNTSRKAINDFNKKLGKELHIKTTGNPTLTNIIKDTAKIKKSVIHKDVDAQPASLYNRNITNIISKSANFAHTSLTHELALILINALDAENPGILILSTTTYETLTDEDKAIATSKGWTIAA